MDDKPEIFALRLLYHEVFGNNSHDFFRQHIDLTVGSWMSDLKQLIDEKSLSEIICEINDKEKAIIVARYLIQKNDIRKYKAFIEIWKKHVPARAEQFQRCLKTKIEDNGLLMVDELYNFASEAQAQRDEDIRLNNIDRNLEYFNDVEMESDKRFSNCASTVEMLSENRSSSGNNADSAAFGHGLVNSSLSNEVPLNFGEHLFDSQYWQKVSMLGKGAYGEVYQYEQVQSKVQIAVKAVKFDPQERSTSSAMGLLQREIENHQSLSHNRIVQYYGYYVDTKDYVVYLCLEYVPGGSIWSYLKSGKRLDNGTVKRYSRQILEGVSYLHGKARPIVHRDIKGANVLIDSNKNVKLADFGMSKELESLTSGGKTGGKGSYRWMAPEVANGEKHGIAADIWSVGCTVIEMITAQPPWKDKKNTEIVMALSKKQLPSYKLLDPFKDADAFIQKCLTVNCKDRPSANDLLNMDYCAAS